jgi:hypothetical protein
MGWAEEEFKGVNLGDKRLNKRLCQLLNQLSKNPMDSIPTACDHQQKKSFLGRFPAWRHHNKPSINHYTKMSFDIVPMHVVLAPCA